ncbi:MAG TPA: hypothetical protein VH141_03240 [Pseudonocardia sp.]|nr:hypothetical protein [Pseudonocardia sp.]
MTEPDTTAGVGELLARFTAPGPGYGPLPIWWWSGAPLTRERLRWQLERLVEGGIRAAVVLCLAPTGPMFGSVADDPPFLSDEWLALFDQVCADAAELGCTLWLYDQIGFSGANLQGQLIAAEPKFAGRALFRTVAAGTDVTLRPPAEHRSLAGYAVLDSGARVEVPLTGGSHDGGTEDDGTEDGAVRWVGEPARVTLVHAGTSGFDYFSEPACAALLDRVHGTLERAVGHWFGRAIGGFFQDELPPMPTWGSDFAATFAARHGYELLPRLWALFEPDGGAEAARVRRDYHEHRAALARRGFFDQHDAWFAARGLTCGFDQASPAREGDPVGGVQTYGDYLGLHAGYGAPGSDHWGDAKVHSSLAHAQGHGRVWIEAFHSSGWGGTLEETYDWLAPFLRRGATLYDPHAVYYATVGGWWEWAPPSTCWRQPYWPSYDVFATAVARLCAVLTAGRHVCDVLLLSPTSTAQAHLTLAGPLPAAELAGRVFRELNGVNTWFAERRGVLERAGIDHDALDEATVADGEVDAGGEVDADGVAAGGLRIGGETYRTVLLPAAAVLTAASARRLLELAAAGGRVVCVGRAPELFVGATGADAELGVEFARAVASGAVLVLAGADEVPAAVLPGPVRVRADAPFLLRRHGAAHVLALIAHDEHSGTAAPILRDGGGPVASGFDWQDYNSQLRETGYRFVPPVDRAATVTLTGPRRPRAQSWSPGSGTRTELAVGAAADGSWTFEVPFDDGAVALVVLAEDLPEPTAEPLGALVDAVDVTGPWTGLAESTLDNTWGDLASAERTGVLPIEVWRLEHAAGAATRSADLKADTDAGPPAEADADWASVVAGFGPFAQVQGPWSGSGAGPDWTDAEWSLSRGIRNDPAHLATLGPKGSVPEEFLDWRHVEAGQRVRVRTHLTLPAAPGALVLVSAGAPRRLWLDGRELAADGAGHQSFSAVPPELAGAAVELLIELVADRDGPLRAAFAVVTDAEAVRRPEWLRPGGEVVVGGSGELALELPLAELPADPTIQVASDGAAAVLVNGVPVGSQGDFNPYPEHREIRVHSYDLGPHLRIGDNRLVLRLTDRDREPTAAAADSTPVHRGGLGITSGITSGITASGTGTTGTSGARTGWTARRGDAAVPVVARRWHERDPRFICHWVRPHPLPGAGWLDPAAAPGTAVLPLVPDLAPGGERTEWLRLALPPGTVSLRVDTPLAVAATVAGEELKPDDGLLRLPAPAPAGTTALLRLTGVDGRRGGALLDGPVEVEVVAAPVPLVPWEELGLRTLGGRLTYRTTVRRPVAEPGTRTVLDLGELRGTADVLVNGTLAGRLVWGPWRAEVTDLLRAGDNELTVVVRGTLAGYLDDASPTSGVYAGQVRTGLLGPVTLRTYRA